MKAKSFSKGTSSVTLEGDAQNTNHTSLAAVISENGNNIFTGSSASHSFVTAWKVEQQSIIPCASMGPMIGGVRCLAFTEERSTLTPVEESLLKGNTNGSTYRIGVVTLPGWVYVWRIQFGENKVDDDAPREQANYELLCVIESSDNPTGPVSVIGFLQDRETLICGGQLPFQSLSLVNSSTGSLLCTIPSLSCQSLDRASSIVGPNFPSQSSPEKRRLAMWNYTCLRVEPSPSVISEKPQLEGHSSSGEVDDERPELGRWVALGNANGMLGLMFISDALLNRLKSSEKMSRLSNAELHCSVHKICDLSVEVLDMAFRPRQLGRYTPVTISVVASDGLVRHWSIEKQRLKLAKADATSGKYHSRFLCYGPFSNTPSEDGEDLYPVLLVAITSTKGFPDERKGSLLNSATSGETVDALNWPHILRCWSVVPSSDHSRRCSYAISSFRFPISGLAHNSTCTRVAVLTEDGSLELYSVEASHVFGLKGLVQVK